MAMLKSLKDRVGILEEQMGTLEGLPEAVGSLTLQISQLSTRMDDEFSAIRLEWDATLERRFREQAEMLDERFAQVNGDLSALRTEIGTLGTEVGTLRSEVGTLGTEVGTLRSEVGTLRSEVGTLRTEVGTLRGEVGSLRTEVGSLRTEVGTLRTEVGTLRTEVGTLGKDLRIVREGVGLILKKLDTR